MHFKRLWTCTWGILLCVTAGANGEQSAINLSVPSGTQGASIPHEPNFISFSIEPAFWHEFWGNISHPNHFTFDILQLIIDHGGQPQIRPGGETMDSMKFEPSTRGVRRITNDQGGIYRTVVGPEYYKSWSLFPPGTKFTSTLNFGNDSLEIARDMAVASVKYQPERVHYFELGNEPNNYGDAATRWSDSTQAYVDQWKNWTMNIDAAINRKLGHSAAAKLGKARWWGSSATTDATTLQVKPVNIIPDGVDSNHQIAQYSIHSYQFATCSPEQTALSTLPDVLNHTSLVDYVDAEIMPSAEAALAAGNQWIVGEYNSVACSGSVNVSDRFAQALWTADTQLIYASRNASAAYLHQGATLVFQSGNQANQAGPNGTPSFSLYDMVYPRSSPARGPARTLPGFLGVLFSAEVFATPGTRIRSLDTPAGISPDYFAAYGAYVGEKLTKLALINMKPYFGSGPEYSVSINIPVPSTKASRGNKGRPFAWAKRMTTPSVNETDSSLVTWAGQSYTHGKPSGVINVEGVIGNGTVEIRGSEALLIFYNHNDIVGL